MDWWVGGAMGEETMAGDMMTISSGIDSIETIWRKRRWEKKQEEKGRKGIEVRY